MNRLELPIQSRTLWVTGDVLLWVELELRLKDGAGGWHDVPFLVDSGTEITTMPAVEARALGLPMPQNAAAGVAHSQTGLAIRSGYLRFQIVGMDVTEYAVPCFFLGDPNTRPAGPPGQLPRNLLQPCALLKQLRLTLDDDPGGAMPHGMLVVEKR